ncbi:MAG: 50S ribosomal protein L10 [bacterium]|nr:50S ribosomal protein L10 [bacterium]
MINQDKLQQVDELSKTLETSSNFVLIKFEKTTHQNLELLRRELKKNQAKVKVIKNTLLEKSLNKLSIKNSLFTEFRKKFFPLKKSSAILILESDWAIGLKSFYGFMQKEKSLSFKYGIIDKQLYAETEVRRLAQLPSKGQLIAQIIGSMKSPISHFTNAIKFNSSKLVYILQQKSKAN